jgi:hypothetical protein
MAIESPYFSEMPLGEVSAPISGVLREVEIGRAECKRERKNALRLTQKNSCVLQFVFSFLLVLLTRRVDRY